MKENQPQASSIPGFEAAARQDSGQSRIVLVAIGVFSLVGDPIAALGGGVGRARP